MAIVTTKYLFTEQSIRLYAPDEGGVYGLYDSMGNTIYYGMADSTTIRNRLLSHHRGNDGSCTQNAASFNFERYSNAPAREKQLLEEYRHQYGKLPRCNDRVG